MFYFFIFQSSFQLHLSAVLEFAPERRLDQLILQPRVLQG